MILVSTSSLIMESLLLSKEHVSNARVIFRMLSKFHKIDEHCHSSNQTKTETEANEFSYSYDKNPKHILSKSGAHKKGMSRRKYLEFLLANTNIKPFDDKTIMTQKEIRNVLMNMTSDKGTREFIQRGSNRVIFSSLMLRILSRFRDQNLIKMGDSIPSRTEDCQRKPHNIEDDCQSKIEEKSSEDFDKRHSSLNHFAVNERFSSFTDVVIKSDKEKLSTKYQQPSEEQVKCLKEMFPEPEKLFHDVMRPVQDAGLRCYKPMLISSHLGGFYWKVKIHLLWPRKLTVVGMHTDKENAKTRAYLATCAQLMDLGLIADKGGTFQLITCDSVIGFLEQVSEYGDMSLPNSRGKGFKIVLEKVKKTFGTRHDDVCFNQVDRGVSSTWQGCETKNHNTNDCSRWSCCVHVGWPKPFSVRMVAPSLPSAQLLALLTVASNFKMMKILDKTNAEINMVTIVRVILQDTSNQWTKCIQSTQHWDNNNVDCGHDAEIYVDASNNGYGAYLIFNDSDKVSWLCESWIHQPDIFSRIFHSLNQEFYLHSTLAELFAVVSTIFSWKKKLVHCKISCYCDNQTAVTLLATLKLSQPSNNNYSHFLTTYDFLINVLRETCNAYNIHIHPVWIQREHNWVADRLATGDIDVFRLAIPNAAPRKTRVKHLQLKDQLSFSTNMRIVC